MPDQSAPSRASRKLRRTLARIVVTSTYLLIATLLVGWELQEQGDLISSDSCELRSASRGEGLFGSLFLNPLYQLISRYPTAPSSNVSVVAIESNLEILQQNVCPARAFTAELLLAIAARQPKVIAIDKFYSDACLPGDPGTIELQKAAKKIVQDDHIPLIVAASTHSAPPPVKPGSGHDKKSDKKTEPAPDACLVLSPQLELVPGLPPAPIVHRGLARLNQDVLRIPLNWPVLSPDPDPKPTSGPDGNSFSLVTASFALDPSSGSTAPFNELINSPQQPFANLSGDLDVHPSLTLFCPKPDVAKSLNITCPIPQTEQQTEQTSASPKRSLKGQVVVIGAESDADDPSVLGKDMYGFELQARYVAALLSGSYLRQIRPCFLLLPLGLYFLFSELLIPYLHIHHHPPRPLFHIERPLLWTIGTYLATIALGVCVPLAFHRFPPLEMLLGISGILIPRLLIEGWALFNEHMEEPDQHEDHA